MLTVAVGVIGIYIVFALITSHITEMIESLLKKRGETLYRGIVSLIGDGAAVARARELTGADAAKSDEYLANQMYDHPLLSNLSPGPNNKPTYIPARAFTLSFLDEFRKIFTKDGSGNVLLQPKLLATPTELFADVIQRIQGLPDGSLKQTLTTIVQSNDQEYEKLLVGIDTLFDTSMQRVSGWFRRWSACVVAAVGAVLVAAFNVDTLSAINQLSQDQAKAQALANAAQQLANNMSIEQLLDKIPMVSFSWSFPPEEGWFLKIAGLLISWFAVMMGAPFWFNLLQRLVPVRLTGDKPAVTAIRPTDQDVMDVQSASRASAASPGAS